MDLEKAKVLLESLYDRIQREGVEGKWKLEGTVSASEHEALSYLLKHLGISVPADIPAPGTPLATPAILPTVTLNTHSASLQSAEDLEAIMCLDFGTAMSKAFAVHVEDSSPFDLAVGQRAGYSEAVYPVPSSLFVSRSGKIYLGHEAISKSLQDSDSGRARFDSPKQEISQGPMTDLSSILLPESVNPSGIPLNKEEAITLYLAYLTDLAGLELTARHGLSRYVRRRFARPCWKKERVEWAELQLSRMLAKAQILADTFTGEWQGGIDIRKIRAAMDKLSEIVPPSFLVAEGVAEPVAAASSIVIRGEPQRRGFLVVDVGAGTTDFGLFVMSELDPSRPRVIQIPNSIEGLRQAGDTIDNILRGAILKRHSVDPEGDYGKRMSAELNLRVRQFKETLFRDRVLRYTLADDTAGEITLDEFQNRPEVLRFKQGLETALQGVLDRVDSSWIKNLFAKQGLMVVLTGGGARLDIVKDLAKGFVSTHGVRLDRTAAHMVPEWIRTEHPEFADEYPQLAVAMGGASPNLPEMGPEVAVFGGGMPRATYTSGNLTK